jgi:hypothetical protein
MADTTLMVIPPEMTAVQLFAPGKANDILASIEEEARAEAAKIDISTKSGREALASLVYKIKRTKTQTDKFRLELVSDRKKELKIIDMEGGVMWDRLEALQKEINQPLDDLKRKNDERVAKHESAIAELDGASTQTSQEWQTLPVEALADRLTEISEAYPSTHDWEEFGSRGALAVKTAIAKITDAITKRETYDAEQIELARLRAEAAERAQKEREDAAAAKAKAEAEETARIAAIEAERKAQQDQERIKRESEEREESIERDRKAAQERAERAERDKAEAEAKSKRDAEAAAQKAEEEKQAAVRAEQERAERERKAEEEAERKRAANRAHSAKINGEAKACLLNHTNLTAENAEEVIKAIVKGLVSHVSIQY